MPCRRPISLVLAVLIVTMPLCMGQKLHEPAAKPAAATPLPIQLEALTEPQRALIRKLHEQDESSYLIDTRPVLFQIQGVKNDQQQSRGPVTFDRPVDVLIYCLGERRDGKLVDWGWIVDANSKRTVWQMDLERTELGGSEQHWRKQVSKVRLPAGSYTLRYQSNDANAVGDWREGQPEREFYYGITVFNLGAIANIKAKLSEAEIPLRGAPSNVPKR